MGIKKWLIKIFDRKSKQVPLWKEAQDRILSKIEKGELLPNTVDSFEFKHAGLLEGLKSSKSEKRLGCLGVLINCMWTEDPKEQADAIKVIASVLKHPDPNMVHKAASGLSELGGIGIRYLEMAAQDPQLNEALRTVILYRARTAARVAEDYPKRRDFSKENLAEEARKIVAEALEETKYHRFSSSYSGTFPSSEDIRHQYVFEIDLSRSKEMQALMSFTRKDGAKVKDQDCFPVVKAFTKHAQYYENLDIPRSSAIRYFSWEAISTEEERPSPKMSESVQRLLKVPNMYGLDLETAIRCGHSPSPTIEAYKAKFITVGAGLEEDLKYLAKLRCPAGSRIQYLCKGQLLAKNGSCARWFVVNCECGQHQAYLHVDSLRSGKLMPPDLPGWNIDRAGTPSPKDEMQGLDLIFIATIEDYLLKLESQCKQKTCPYNIVLDPTKSILKITFRPDGANPLPRFAQLGYPPRPQPDFAVFRPSGSLGEYSCEFGNIKKKGEYWLHFLADTQSIYAKKKQK